MDIVEITDIDFSDDNVKAICVSNWDRDSDGELSVYEAAVVTNLGDAFKNNKDIKTFNELKYFTGITSIDANAFENSGLTSISIPESITSIGSSAFYGCSDLEKVIVPNIAAWCNISFADRSSNPLRYAHHLYRDVDSEITDLTIPDDVAKISNYAFCDCSNLTSVTISESVTSIGYYAFYGCSSLAAIAIPKGVASIGSYAFTSCASLTSITVAEGNSVYDSRNGCNAIIKSASNTLMTGCMNTIIPKGVTDILSYAFYKCSGLTSVNIPESITSIGRSAFDGCSGLQKVIAPNIAAWCNISFEASSSNPLYHAHHLYHDKDTEITDLVIPSEVTAIGISAFYNCSGLKSVIIPKGVTSIGSSAFFGCSGLTSITIPEGITSIGFNVFSDCTSLTSVTIPEGVTDIGSSAFSGCSSLSSISLPKSVINIEARAFTGCSSLTSISIPDGVTNILMSTFYECTSLTSIKIPDSVISIAAMAFYGCSNLSSIYIGNGMKSIADMAFGNCNSIKNVYCYATDIPSMTGAFNSTIADATLHVPAVSFNAYRSSWYWGKFGTIVPLTDEEVGIEQIEDGQSTMDNEAGAWFSLDGKKLNSKPDTKGIFIRNGKKVLVK